VFTKEKPGNYESGQDEEGINSDEAAREMRNPCMKQDDQENCNSPEALDVRSELPVTWCRSGLIA
jgi:hypothetical protein